ncbi:MAG: hypothetical protein HN494_10660 [Opitutae bacterium]|nr:hypothetical protein [Opitutae bacterium]MBT4666326.1 hypothetical protein [Opitutae bacterium]MBT5909762.1 hypothetical protein [Opitutae bacterium]MBT6852211.1 hypothetical protein [Opitutae bacterium]MBT7741058.1 hypothetical protein [Opitutae bacterium]
MKSVRTPVLLLAVLTIFTILNGEPKPTPDRVSYSRDIHPIISEKCFTCHGNDPGSREASLRVDAAEHVLAKWITVSLSTTPLVSKRNT